MGSFRKKKIIVALINEHGEVLQKPVRCPKCNKKVFLFDNRTVHCKRCGAWDIRDLVNYSSIEYTKHLVFIKTD